MFFGAFFSILAFLGCLFLYIKPQIKKNREQVKKIRRQFEESHSSGGINVSSYLASNYLKQVETKELNLSSIFLPFSLCNIPLGEESGVILDVKTIPIRNVSAPYNASIIENPKGEGFLLFFRYDEFYHDCRLPFRNQIGCVKLDEELNQTEEEFKKIQFENEFNEDPRAFSFQDNLYLVYNSIRKNRPENSNARIMKLARLNKTSLTVEHEIELDIRLQEIEKNWTPFCYTANGQDHFFFKYYLLSNQNLRIQNFDEELEVLGELSVLKKPSVPNLGWAPTWGEPRGGTPALKIGEEYLSFFHSSFRCNDGSFWYIFGAYTFESEPPFRVTRISHYPIFYKGIFTSPILNTGNPILRAVFPCGFVLKKKEGKELIYLSIGENDSCIKILTLDKEALLNSLKKIHTSPPNPQFKTKNVNH